MEKFKLYETETEILIWGLESLIVELEKAGEILTGELYEECYSRKSRAESLLKKIRIKTKLSF